MLTPLTANGLPSIMRISSMPTPAALSQCLNLLQSKSFVGLAYQFVFADGDNYEAEFANEDDRNRRRFNGRTSALVEPARVN